MIANKIVVTVADIVFSLENEELICESIGTTDIHLPIYLLVEKTHACGFCKWQLVSANNNMISCVGKLNEDNICSCIISTKNNSIDIEIKSNNNQTIGIMWPVHSEKNYFGDNIYPIPYHRFCGASYKEDTRSDSLKLNIPCIHHIEEFCTSVFLLESTARIQLLEYLSNLYCSALCSNLLRVSFKQFNDIRESLRWWRDTHKSSVSIAKLPNISIGTMKQIMYNDYDISDVRKPSRELLKLAKNTQQLLLSNNIDNCLIGSLAMSLHGIEIEVRDIDIAITSAKNLDRCKKLLSKHYDIIEPEANSKWSNCAIRVLSEYNIDICYISQIDYQRTFVDRHCYQVLDKRELLLMKLLYAYEQSSYTTCPKNHDLIATLIKNTQPLLYPFQEKDLLDRFEFLYKMIHGLTWSSIDIDIKHPCISNVFKLNDNEVIVVIINLGDPCETIIRIKDKISSAYWLPLDENIEIECEIECDNNTSCISISKIVDLGLLKVKYD